MQVLENILQEIEDEMRYYRKASTDGRITYGIASHRDYQAKGTAEGLQKAMQIIRSHMGDEPVSNPDKLNDGWIPVEERLPKESGTYIVSAKENDLDHVTFCKWQVRYKRWDLTGSRAYWKVIAWQPFPVPYQPKEEKRK